MKEYVTAAGYVSKMDDEWLLFEKDKEKKIATIVLNRPETLNALNFAMWCRLKDVVEAVNVDDEVKVLIFKGAGRSFSSGHDVKELGIIHGVGSSGKERRPGQRHRLLVDASMMGPEGNSQLPQIHHRSSPWLLLRRRSKHF